MQKLAGSVPRPTALSGVLCGRYAVGLCRKRQDRLSFAQAGENASGCPPARRARLGCDCSSLSPLTLKPLRSPTPCPFTAIATALYVRLRRTRGSAVNGHGYGGFGSWLQRRQPSTMSAGCFLGFDQGRCAASGEVRFAQVVSNAIGTALRICCCLLVSKLGDFLYQFVLTSIR